MADLTEAIARLKRLSDRQASDVAREISGYLHNDCGIPFVTGRSLDELGHLMSELPHKQRESMVEAVHQLAARFEHIRDTRERTKKIRLTEAGRYFRTTFDFDQFRVKGWPELEFAEVFNDCVVRKVWKMQDGSLSKDSIDGSWNESVASLEPDAPSLGDTGFSVVEAQTKDQFEQLWEAAQFIFKEGDERWETVDTTAPTDPSFVPLLGLWTAADGAGDTIEFTLNGIALVSRPGASMQFFRYSIQGTQVSLDPETGENPFPMALHESTLIDQTGRRFRSVD